MKNKILIPIALITSFNISQAEYSAKIFIDGLSFKNEIQTPVIPPSTNCLFDQDNNIWAISNISDSTNGMGIIMGETMAFYNEKVIGSRPAGSARSCRSPGKVRRDGRPG